MLGTQWGTAAAGAERGEVLSVYLWLRIAVFFKLRFGFSVAYRSDWYAGAAERGTSGGPVSVLMAPAQKCSCFHAVSAACKQSRTFKESKHERCVCSICPVSNDYLISTPTRSGGRNNTTLQVAHTKCLQG